MAWMFMDFGLLMPAAVLPELMDPEFTEDGKYDLQVRGRVEDHLTYFMDNFMEAGTFHAEIQHTPDRDYNMRFYTTREAYADAIRLAVLAIDYNKFKPMAERKNSDGSLKFKGGRLYHSVLNGIWGSVCELAAPGGYWGTVMAKRSSFEPTETIVEDPKWSMDYSPETDTRIENLLSEVAGVPVDQWDEFLSSDEMALVTPFKEDARRHESKTARKLRRLNKRNTRSSLYSSN